MRRLSLPLALCALLTSLFVGSTMVAAQAATPSPQASTPCDVAPRPADETVSLWFDQGGSPVATPQIATPVASESDLPQGTQTDQATIQQIDHTLREWVTCFDEEQYLRGFALMTDHLVAEYGPELGSASSDVVSALIAELEGSTIATPTASSTPTSTSYLDGPRDVRTLNDGRVGGIWGVNGDEAFVIFQKNGDTWLIDDFVDITESGTPTP